MSGVVLSCTRPRGARRFVCAVSIAAGLHGSFINDRIYCWEDGTGEEIEPKR